MLLSNTLRCSCLSHLRLWLTFLLFIKGINAVEKTEFDADFCGDILCSFEHLEIDTGQNKLYVGAVNWLYQLSSDLKVERSFKTGPLKDSEKCFPHSVCNQPMVSTNNYNKLLKIDFDNNRLVACGSIRQGVCDLRQLGNITNLLNDFKDKANDPRANDFVASTLRGQSTVAFIAKEGAHERDQSLYVGSSRTAEDSKLIADDDQFLTFASRRMPSTHTDVNMFSSDLTTSTDASDTQGLLMRSDYSKQSFRVDFISAFAGHKNGYFVLNYPMVKNDAVQRDDIRAYVAQVCLRLNNDATTNSYFEIPISSLSYQGGRPKSLFRVIATTTSKVGTYLETSLGITNRNRQNPDVLFASFATEGENAGGSTVAIFPLYELDRMFYRIVKSCFNGYKTKHVEWQREAELPCNDIPIQVQEPVCSNQNIWDVIGLLKSNETKQGYTIFESNNTIITSLAVTKLGDHTVVFMGTQDGRLLKLKIDAKPAGSRLPMPYETVTIDSHSDSRKWKNLGSPEILSDMRFDNGLTRLYIMSERRLVSMPLHDCTKYQTCYDCLKPGDPFCGWCTLENRCTAADQCSQDQYKFATTTPDSCPKLNSVLPEALSVTDGPKNLRVSVENIPDPYKRGLYFCNFGGKHESRAQFQTSSFTCQSPPSSKMPALNGKEVSMPLTLIYKPNSGNINTIASTEIVFYDCQNFKSCLPCVSSNKFNCHWCINDNKCTQRENTCKTTPGEVSTPQGCPQLLEVIKPLYLHLGQARTFKVRAEPLPSISGASKNGFKCEFDINGKKERVNASHTSSLIVCDAIKGFLPDTGNVAEAKAHINVYWNEQFKIDNPNNLNVTMYQCSRGPDDNCGKCLLLSQGLACGWCEREKKCTLCDNCQGGSCVSEAGLFPGWLDQSQDCKHPKITNFYPKSAAPGGTTKITIEGENLGRNYTKLYNGVRIAGNPCMVTSEGYKESERVTCEVQDDRGEMEGPVMLCIQRFGSVITDQDRCRGSDYRTESPTNFRFVDPKLENFEPKQGLNAGGTKVTFTGQHLDIGNDVSVLINGRPCPVDKKNHTSTSFSCKLACETSSRRSRRHSLHHPHHRDRNSRRRHRTKRSVEGRVVVIFDEREKYYGNVFFLERDATVSSVSPRESITSGGMKLTITGYNLHLAQEMVLKVSSGIHTTSKVCSPSGVDKNVRECLSPDISDFPIGNYTAQLVLDVCLTLDIGSIKYTKDPFLNLFEGDDHELEHLSGPIIITGRNLCPNPLKCNENSVRVDIGDSLICNVTSIDKDKLVCVPPEGAGGTHQVTVFIGGYNQVVGYLKFKTQLPWFFYIIFVVVILIVFVIVGVCVYRNRADKNSQAVKALQMELDMMEAKVAKECKEAFAELQTDMLQDLDNLSSVGIPFRHRHDYIMRVLFPDPEMFEKLNQAMHTPYEGGNRFNHHNGRGGPRTLCQALENFDKLLENKTFLLTFILTLEQQRKFTMKDKGNVAGLLMIVLQNRLQYGTEILEELLAKYIRHSMDSKSHPKLLLRRTESVAEKMLTHWFSILLHGFLLECAGEPLFMLYRAIKAQLDKGPIDAITGEAKYSLSEDKLLRQAVNYENLILNVIENESGESMQPVTLQVKVLDCDTISQTKGKIIAIKFKNLPQSAHPDPDDFDLEITQETLGRAILNDEDNTSVIEGGWKRINTLLHYKVKDQTVVAMVPKKPAFNQSMNSNHSFNSKVGGMRYNGSGHRLINDGAGSLPRYMTSMQGSRSTTPTIIDDGKKLYHLAKHHDNEPKDGGSDVGNKMASEIYLTRLLATKGTIQKFVDDLFETIFSVIQRGHALPLAIKHMFDFLDEQGGYHAVVDPDVMHAWKSNCLPLRFWVNLIKNPQFLFDINKSALVDSCLTVIGQTFMDSCSKSDHVLGKDSPSNKLLYAKDIPNYKQWVEKYYNEIHVMEPLNPRDMQCFLDDESRTFRSNPSSQAALTQLYLYVQKYSSEILDALNDDPDARHQRLAQKLEQVATTMTSTV